WVTGGWTCAVLSGLVVCTGSFVVSVPCLTTLDGVGMVGPLYATPLQVVIPFRSSLGLVTVLPGSVPDPEDEAMRESGSTLDEMVGVEEFEFTLATTALARDCRTFDLLSMIFKQSEGILSK
nr:hypothetical protein [Tanacetum cinerariifolium]